MNLKLNDKTSDKSIAKSGDKRYNIIGKIIITFVAEYEPLRHFLQPDTKSIKTLAYPRFQPVPEEPQILCFL